MKTLPTALKFARWMGLAGLVCGLLYSVGGFIIDMLTVGLNLGTALAFLALPGMPVLFGLLGFLLGAAFALLSGLVDTLRHRGGN